MARAAGVANSSVSRVLNGHPNVTDELRHRVEQAVVELGYETNLLAHGLRRGLTSTVGCIVRDIAHPLFSDVIKGAEARLGKDGYSVLITNSGGDPDADAKHIRLFRQRQVDGLIVSLASEQHAAVLEALEEIECPYVLVDRELDGKPSHRVVSENESGTAAAVSDMLSLGHRRIAFIGGALDVAAARERHRGYLRAHAEHGVPVDESLVRVGSLSTEFGYEQTRRALRGKQTRPTAIFLGGIHIATGCLVALHELGLRVGDDIGIASFDDSELLRLTQPPISVVARDRIEIGVQAADLLLRAIADPSLPPEERRLPTEYIARGSVARIGAGRRRTSAFAG